MLITGMTLYLLGKQAEMKEDGWGTGLLCNIMLQCYYFCRVMQKPSNNVSFDAMFNNGNKVNFIFFTETQI